MNLSPQSEAIIQKLLDGNTIAFDKLAIGPFDQKTRALLALLVKRAGDIGQLKGENQAAVLRGHYATAVDASQEGNGGDVPAANVSVASSTVSPGWKLERLRCSSIRGIAKPGEEFEFDFNGQSNLIYGPNGSGKSSLLGAVAWIVLGKTIIDSSDVKDDVPLYKPAEGTKSGSKVRDWPVVATLPMAGDLSKAVPQARGELHLTSLSDSVRLILRREYGKSLEFSEDGSKWSPAEQLSDLGIEPLDLQLSLVAPTVFGRRGIEEADDTRRILSLMLGFDDLERLGALASTLSGNRTRLFNSEREELDQKALALTAALRVLPSQLPEGSDERKQVDQLAQLSPITTARIDAAKACLENAAAIAERHLAEILGLVLADGKPPAGLADQLTIAVDKLSKGFADVCPLFHAACLPSALPADNKFTSAERLAALTTAFHEHVASAKATIKRRYEWWLEETGAGSKSAMLLAASKHFDVSVADCPVCERPLDSPDLLSRLTSLKVAEDSLGTPLRTFFGDILAELSRVVPSTVTNLGSQSLSDRIKSDWSNIRDKIVGPTFATLTETFEASILELQSKALVPDPPPIDVLPVECNGDFLSAASQYCLAVHNTQRSLDLLALSTRSSDKLRSSFDAMITNSVDTNDSLLAKLSKGKGAAAIVKPLLDVSKALTNARKAQAAIDEERRLLQILVDLEEPLNQLKTLSKYAEHAVRSVFESIKEQTVANLKHLYPESPTGMRPGKLRLGTGKDKTVEALLTTELFEVPGQYFANAGLQRAIALSFYFSLLAKHRGGLGFIIMDDPILSLDEDHRERWCTHILKPTLKVIQVILATHQRQFLQSCSQDFDADRIVELNPRDRQRRVSWRPGDRIRRAAQQLADGDWLSAGMMLRKFGEDTLISFDAYSPNAFFDQDNLSSSADKYAKLSEPHPLASDAQKSICKRLKKTAVTQVLNPSAHSMTEADVTRPMVEDCLQELRDVAGQVNRELQRLDKLRTRNLRASVIEVSIISFPSLLESVIWKEEIRVPLVAAAAAKSDPWAVEFSDDHGTACLAPGAAVQVVGDSLEPIARHGQWVLLADEGAVIHDGDLVAVCDPDGAKYLRRVWSDVRDWILQSINPVRPMPSITISKRNASVRKVAGVIYTPVGTATKKTGNVCEWLPCSALNAASVLRSCKAIDVVGESMSPIARDGQKVLVDVPLSHGSTSEDGELAVVQFHDSYNSDIGDVIKQVFRVKKDWALVSPNPVDRLPPIIVPLKAIRAIWPLRGVLFDAVTDDSV